MSEIIERIRWGKVNRGSRDNSKRVLDVGGGFAVDSRATDAVDKFHTPAQEDYPEKENIADVNYYPKHVDVDKKGLPYGDELFDQIVSYGAFGWNFGNNKSASEIKRVLKNGGKLEIGISEENKDYVIELLENAGFERIQATKIKDANGDTSGMVKITAYK